MEWKIKTLKLIEKDVSDERFIEYLTALISKKPLVILLSGSNHDSAKHSLVLWNPYKVFRIKGKNHSKNPIDLFNEFINSQKCSYNLEISPFMGGAVGYISYEAKNFIERLPQSAKDDIGLPDLFFFLPQEMLIHQRETGRLYYIAISPSENFESSFVDRFCLEELSKTLETVDTLKSNLSKEEYILAVEKIKNYIRDGHVYQVNLSQRYSFDMTGNMFSLWIKLFQRNPAPFYAFVRDENYFILSTSMERFLFVKEGIIETRPIKGTRPRGKTKEEDESLKRDLLEHPKDDAELSMIVDLLRNDLGKVCIPGSVEVAEHKRVESYHNVHHLISIIRGKLAQDVDYGKIIRATFPGGSITGCPKIRSMEIIDELEPNVRHVYTGSIGYFGFHGNMDLNIAIRTMIALEKSAGSYRGFLSVGGGVVYDSDPELEYEETLHKGKTFFEILKSFARKGNDI